MNFLDEIVSMYLEKVSNIFSITGNISDIVLNQGVETKILPLVVERFEENNHVVLYSPSKGMRFSSNDHKKEFLAYDTQLAKKHSAIFGLDYANSKYNIVSGLHHVSELLLEYRRLRLQNDAVKSVIIIFEDADIIFPSKPINQMGVDEKMVLSLARNTFDTSEFVSGTDVVLMFSKNYYSVDENIRDIPTLESVTIDLPDLQIRKAFIKYNSELDGNDFNEDFMFKIAAQSAGISLTSLKSILKERKSDIERNIKKEVSKIISKTMGGKVSVFIPGYDYSAVIGYQNIKDMLMKMKKRMFLSNNKLIWKGLLFMGATGVGKDFILEAFLKEVDLPVIKLGNLKSKWYGETLQTIEKLRLIVKSFDKVILLKTEADTMFSDPEDNNTHQTDQEMMGMFLDWMGDNKDRGRVFWVFNTSRPQNLPTDFQRRVEMKIPIFDLQGDEKWIFVKKMFELNDFKLEDGAKDDVMEVAKDLSNDNIRAIVAEVVSEQEISGKQFKVTDVLEVINNLNFTLVGNARQEQSEQAEKYSTYKSLLPQR